MRLRRWARAMRAFFALPGSRRFEFVLLVFGGFLAASTVIVDTRYRSPEGAGLSFAEAAYSVFSLVFVNPIHPLPRDALARAVFFLVPPFGLAVLGQSAARIAGAALNREKWERAVASTHHDHVIVCGLGRVGFRVVRWLLDLGEDVVAVDARSDNQFLHQVRSWRVPVIQGDARRPEVLEEAGIMRASAIAPITSDDLVNLAIATQARSLRPGFRVVMRTFEDSLASNLETGFDINAAYSQSALAAPAFAAAALHAPVDYAFAFGEEERKLLLTITKFTVVEGSKLVGYSIGKLEEEFGVKVLAHRTESFELHPRAHPVLSEGDGFVVSATRDSLRELGRLTPPTREMPRYLAGRWEIEKVTSGNL